MGDLTNPVEDPEQRLVYSVDSKSPFSHDLPIILNFLKWLHRPYPWDYENCGDRPQIGDNEIRDFLRSKGFDQVDTSYLLKFLKVGYAAKL